MASSNDKEKEGVFILQTVLRRNKALSLSLL